MFRNGAGFFQGVVQEPSSTGSPAWPCKVPSPQPTSRPEHLGLQDVLPAFPWARCGQDRVLATTPEVPGRCNVQEVLDRSSYLIVQCTYYWKKVSCICSGFYSEEVRKRFFLFIDIWTYFSIICVVLPITFGLLGEWTVLITLKFCCSPVAQVWTLLKRVGYKCCLYLCNLNILWGKI